MTPDNENNNENLESMSPEELRAFFDDVVELDTETDDFLISAANFACSGKSPSL